MAAPRIIQIIAGRWKSTSAVTTATPDSVVATDATGHIALAQMPVGVGADTFDVAASEAISDGMWVNIWDDTGVAKARKADGSTVGKEVWGFVLAAVAFPGTATVYQAGVNTHLSGLTPGEEYFLSTTPGVAVATTPPAAVGNVIQTIGKAISATAIEFRPGPYVEIGA